MQNERFFDDMVDGAAGLAVVIGIVVMVIGILPAIFLRERLKNIADTEATVREQRPGDGTATSRIAAFFHSCKLTLKSRPFLNLCAATFLVFNGFILIASFQSYVIIYYVFGGDTVRGAEFAGYAGTAGAISTFFVIAFITWLGTHLGKKRTFYVAMGVSMLGYALKWICYDPEMPWLLLVPTPFLAFGLGGLFTLIPSMIADVVDMDELQTFERREGLYGAVFWWVVKLGMAAALAASGVLLNATGFDVALGGNQPDQTIFMMRVFDCVVPFIASGLAIWAIAAFPITEQRAHEIRRELEARRGAA
jgi:GPH family glycoside/pentoside/hexuronide:cation symporter